MARRYRSSELSLGEKVAVVVVGIVVIVALVWYFDPTLLTSVGL